MEFMSAEKGIAFYHISEEKADLLELLNTFKTKLKEFKYRMRGSPDSKQRVRMIETQYFVMISQEPNKYELLVPSALLDNQGRKITHHYNIPLNIGHLFIDELLSLDHRHWMKREDLQTGKTVVDITNKKHGTIN